MQRHPRYTRDRIAQVGDRIRALIHADVRDPDLLEVAGPVGRIGEPAARELEYRGCELGEQFGPLWATYWFRTLATVPAEWSGERVDLLWDSHSEATLWRDGRSLQGLNSSPEGARLDALLLDPAAGGERLELRVELACNGLFGRLPQAYSSLQPVVLDRCQIARFDRRAWALHHDFDVLRALEAEWQHGLDPTWAGLLLAELNRFCNVWLEDDFSTWDEAEAILAGLMTRRNASSVHELSAIGHAHLDTAWLWPIEETYRKAVRSFSSQTTNMERYPEFRFACSQAQQYDWIRRRNPDLYDRIRDRVETGQWIPVGGTWIEPDCNLPSGESLVRQFLYGQRFFEREFGRRCREFWNPDVFGYNGQLPQIMRGAGIDRFLTQKLSWNRFTTPQHHTFTWQGIDGSQVLPADTYNSSADVSELRRTAREYKDHDRSRHSLLVYGWGDGGGGPTPEMLERLRRAADLQGLPRTRPSTSDEFFDALEADAGPLPTIVGELYFEYHRGTYTTQAAVKKGNANGERALHDAELLSAIALREGRGEYPAERLGELWQLLLVNQFHDILPGSSIGLVYQDAARDHAAVLAGAGEVIQQALDALAGHGEGWTPLNTVAVGRAQVCEHPDHGLVWVDAPALGFGAVGSPPAAVIVEESGERIVLRNGLLRAEFDRGGRLRSLVLAESGREALDGIGNLLQIYDDRPTNYDAWDVDPFHLETVSDCPPASSATVIAAGGLRGEVVFEHRVGRASTLRQVVRLDAGSARLEFHCQADWRERHTMLKVLFPVAVHAANATYQMQFGYTERPTHFSTSHDLARFEVPGHRFADLSEHGFGVALLTDCKYGYSTYGGEMRISLLRSPAVPDPQADIGSHSFTYAVMPHAGGWREAGVVAEAARFEAPLRWARGVQVPRSLASVDDPNLMLDTVKRAEDSDALLLRLYEAHGARGVARLRLELPFGDVVRCSLLEDAGRPVEVEDGAVVVEYGPHEIISLLVR